MKQTILVTGSAGFIGQAVVPRLLADGYQVIAMCRPGTIPPFETHASLTVLYADIANYEDYESRLKQVDAIVHLAANKYHPKLSWSVNLQGATNIVRLIRENRIKGKRVINISSQSTKIKYRGVYGESKRQSDSHLQTPEIAWTTLKPSLVYGPGKGTLFATIKGYVKKLPVVPMIGNGKWELYPIDVEDLAQIISRTIKLPETIHQTYDLGDTEKVTFDELVGLIQQELKTEKPILHIPVWIGLPLVWLLTKLIPSLPFNVDNVLGSTQNTNCKPNKAVKEIGVKPLTIKAGIKKYLGKGTKNQVKVAVVGLGKMGILHASVLSANPDARVVAIVDREQALGNTALSMGIDARFYTSLDQAIEQEQIEAVYICTPTFAHLEVIKICERNNLPYFVEKPVFPHYSAFDEIQANEQNMAGYFWIYKRESKYAKELIMRGEIGQIKSYKIKLKHGEVFGAKKGWMFVKKLSGGGVLANPGPHALSLATYLFGEAEVTKSEMTYLYGNEVEDRANLILKHRAVTGQVTADWSVPNHPIMTIEFEILGDKGKIKFANNKLVVKTKRNTKTLSYDQLPVPNVFDLNPKAGGDAYYLESQAFISSIKNKQKFVNSMRFAQTVEKIMSEAYAKAK